MKEQSIKRKTPYEVIDETVEYYRTHNRGIGEDGGCVYFHDNCVCAVGRFMKNPQAFAEMRDTIDCLIDDKVIKKVKHFKPEYTGLKKAFLINLQTLHDDEDHWKINKEGGQDLSASGKDWVNWMKRKFR